MPTIIYILTAVSTLLVTVLQNISAVNYNRADSAYSYKRNNGLNTNA